MEFGYDKRNDALEIQAETASDGFDLGYIFANLEGKAECELVQDEFKVSLRIPLRRKWLREA